MNNLFRGLLAGWGASKLGGGCLGTILVFALIWWALGTCDGNQHAHIPKKIPEAIAGCAQGNAIHKFYPLLNNVEKIPPSKMDEIM